MIYLGNFFDWRKGVQLDDPIKSFELISQQLFKIYQVITKFYVTL